jgi:phosphoribosylglycinamide formyltransferase-1
LRPINERKPTTVQRVDVAVLASHAGTNLMALHSDLLLPGSPAAVRLVISNNADAGALQFAASHGIAAVHLSSRTHPGPGEADQFTVLRQPADD